MGTPELDVEQLVQAWPGQRVILETDPHTGSWIIVAVHSVRRDRYDGGTRMRRYPTVAAGLADAMRLAEGMTLKWAVHGIPVGGAKAVIVLRGAAEQPGADQQALLRLHGELVRSLRGAFTTGGDIGTSPELLDTVAGAAGGPWVYGSAAAPIGWGDSSVTTAAGLLASTATTARWLDLPDGLRGARVAVQGAGKVGQLLIQSLLDAGAQVTAADVDPTATRWLHAHGVTVLDPEQVLYDECDILAPCASGGVLNAETIPSLRCRAVVGAANNQLAAPEDAARLQARGVRYAPDFVVNGGGAIADLGMDELRWTHQEAIRRAQAIGTTLDDIYREAAASGGTPLAAALARAEAFLQTP